ncbi:MAG: sulfate adenylyltransferase [Frankiaceae bacterium]|nr:sulfate adenylyltransferase [Frankiaceae bacterium]
MPDVALTLDPDLAAVLDQVLMGLLPADALPAADVYLDEEGAAVARRDEGGGLVAVRPLRWALPAEVRTDGPVVVARAGEIPAGPLPAGVVVLLPAGGVRPDDARWPAWAAAWSQGAASVVETPVPVADAALRAEQVAAAYSSGPLVEVDTVAHGGGSGRTVFFTGLSGSGKSTVARSVVERLAGARTITLLDGDVVRTHLSKGLGFSAEDRDTNIRRIGWVAAEVTKHGGLAVCAPIAPYDATRRWVRETVEAAGGPGSFVLVWIATPIEVCEERDVKGLYAKARAGEIKGFTGIDDPYEEPTDAELVIDTSLVSLEDAVDRVVSFLDQTT